MKKLILILVFFSGFIFTQQYEDVVYLKNGSIIRGIIIEQAPNRHIKIQSGQNVFVYQMDEIDKMTKEISKYTSSVKDKTWSIQAGFGTHRSFSLIAISKDFRIGNNGSFFITAGLGSALIGAGFSVQSDYNNNGLNFSGVFGINAAGPTLNSNLGYQWKIGNQGFVSAGVMGGIFSLYDYWYGYVEYPYILPTVAIDFRF